MTAFVSPAVAVPLPVPVLASGMRVKGRVRYGFRSHGVMECRVECSNCFSSSHLLSVTIRYGLKTWLREDERAESFREELQVRGALYRVVAVQDDVKLPYES